MTELISRYPVYGDLLRHELLSCGVPPFTIPELSAIILEFANVESFGFAEDLDAEHVVNGLHDIARRVRSVSVLKFKDVGSALFARVKDLTGKTSWILFAPEHKALIFQWDINVTRVCEVFPNFSPNNYCERLFRHEPCGSLSTIPNPIPVFGFTTVNFIPLEGQRDPRPKWKRVVGCCLEESRSTVTLVEDVRRQPEIKNPQKTRDSCGRR